MPSNVIWNVPNTLTMLRLVLAIVVFSAIPWQTYSTTLTALIVFIIAAGTDWVDGYWARRFNQITQLGRILDPFVDKILICGAFVLLAAEQLRANQQNFGIAGWMAVVVMGREMLVTGLRSFMEQSGSDFSAKWSGKWKMVFQCLAVGSAMVCLMHHQQSQTVPMWLWWTQIISAWLAVIATIYSGVEYIIAAVYILRK